MSKLANPVFQNIVDMIGGLIKKKKKKKLTIAPSKTSVLKKFTALAPSKPVEIPISYFPKKRPVGRPRRLYDEDAPKVRRRTKAQIAIDEAEAIRQAEEFGKVTAVKRLKTNPFGVAFRQKAAEKREQKKAKAVGLLSKLAKKKVAERTAKEEKALLLPEFEVEVGTPRRRRRTYAEQDDDLDKLVEELRKTPDPKERKRLTTAAGLTKYQKKQLEKYPPPRPARAVGEAKEEEELAPLVLPVSPKGKVPPPPSYSPPAALKKAVKKVPGPPPSPVPAEATGLGRFRKRRKY